MGGRCIEEGHTLVDDTSGFVTEDHGLLDDEVTDATVDEVVDIRAAYTGLLYCDEDLVLVDCIMSWVSASSTTNRRRTLGDGSVLKLGLLDGLEDERRVVRHVEERVGGGGGGGGGGSGGGEGVKREQGARRACVFEGAAGLPDRFGWTCLDARMRKGLGECDETGSLREWPSKS